MSHYSSENSATNYDTHRDLTEDLSLEERHGYNAHLLGAVMGLIHPDDWAKAARAARADATRKRTR